MADYSLATGQPVSGGPYNRELNHREPFTQTLQLYSFHAGYDLGRANLDWISSYQNFLNHSVQDYPDGFLVLYNQVYPALGGDSALSSLYVDSQYNVHKASQEIRLTSRKGDRFDSRYAHNYRVVSNPRAYGLYAAPRGQHWVRSGNDALLVGLAGGVIGAIIANAF